METRGKSSIKDLFEIKIHSKKLSYVVCTPFYIGIGKCCKQDLATMSKNVSFHGNDWFSLKESHKRFCLLMENINFVNFSSRRKIR